MGEGGWGGRTGGHKLQLPVPCSPTSHTLISWLLPFSVHDLWHNQCRRVSNFTRSKHKFKPNHIFLFDRQFLTSLFVLIKLLRDISDHLVFSVSTASYGSLFFPFGFMACTLRAWVINPSRKNSVSNLHYYMASSVSGQDEPNLALWMATRVGYGLCPTRKIYHVLVFYLI